MRACVRAAYAGEQGAPCGSQGAQEGKPGEERAGPKGEARSHGWAGLVQQHLLLLGRWLCSQQQQWGACEFVAEHLRTTLMVCVPALAAADHECCHRQADDEEQEAAQAAAHGRHELIGAAAAAVVVCGQQQLGGVSVRDPLSCYGVVSMRARVCRCNRRLDPSHTPALLRPSAPAPACCCGGITQQGTRPHSWARHVGRCQG